MTSPSLRRPTAGTHWLSARHRRALVVAIAGRREPDHHLRAVLTELTVAEARAAAHGSAVAALRRIGGIESDAVPVRLNASELGAVLRLPLDDDLTERLGNGAWGSSRRRVPDGAP